VTYQGTVVPGGPPEVRELTDLIVTKVSVGPMDNNAYLLRCRATGEELLVDAAAEPERLIGLVGDGPLTTIVTTHAHRDHWGALPEVATATGAQTVAHPGDATDIGYPTDRLVDDGSTVAVGSVSLRVIHLDGHTPGSIALLYDDPHGTPHLWTGDALFPGGPGKTTPETFPVLMRELETKVFAPLPDETWVYPGHGNDTTLGRERAHLPEWWARGW
jgi:glyoxylase-like metal-dependent hydrolase (beta-lactamase superfamily II)